MFNDSSETRHLHVYLLQEFTMINLVLLRAALHATALALMVATTFSACGGDNQGPAGSAVDNSASTPANGG